MLVISRNKRPSAKELAFLEVADNEFKPVMTTQIGIALRWFGRLVGPTDLS
jgi:hypothetical protein